MALTAEIHKAIEPYNVSGAQHGTSGNSSERLREIANRTCTTKANVATALQMISWGVRVNDYGNAQLDENGEFIKDTDAGVTEETWSEMVAYAKGKDWKKGDYKKLNLPFENRLLGQASAVRKRMVRAVEQFTYTLLTEVFNAGDTAPLAVEAILSGRQPPQLSADRLIRMVPLPLDWHELHGPDRSAADRCAVQ